ncbi:MAG TPA: hypothetical protein VGK67_37525 [Myxococcales bacterium]
MTEAGRAALAAYQESIALYQTHIDKDRGDMDRLQKGWAETYKVTPPDATILGEFSKKDLLPREVQSALDDCGTTLREVQAAVDRLYTAGLLSPTGGGGPLPAHATEGQDDLGDEV